ncbi:hypothetical protein KO525_08885 [Psychrosphaera sp. B3R10]|uniref:hypothetical protein n=1 Tax=unclassified Psychrosphaera TaxID=2641570 RepID=UPI001C0906F9|nr:MULTISPECIES: hypothetical protein [unclassified Psychrosphaera]MBU2881499.1 hypothetical protein [Psychrosphaera sp. I2R16]MBU2989489.1 hypothetical protein [Psychrosphaera sp. B3R10]
MENLKSGFLWGLGFGLSITIIVLISQYLNPNEFEKMKDYTPTKIGSFEVISKVGRVEGSNFIIAGEYKVTGSQEFERYRVDAVIRNVKGIFLQQCSSDIDTHSVEVEKNFTKVIVCRDFSDVESASSVEINLVGFK